MLAGCKTAVAVVYMWTGRTAKERNRELWDCLRVDKGDLHGWYHILLMGDFNAHLDSLDGATDVNGQELSETVERFNLVIGKL